MKNSLLGLAVFAACLAVACSAVGSSCAALSAASAATGAASSATAAATAAKAARDAARPMDLRALDALEHAAEAVAGAAEEVESASVGPAFVDSWTHKCRPTASALQSSAGSQRSIYCQNMNAKPVAVGKSTVTATTGPVFCSDSAACPRPDWGADARLEYCAANSDAGITVDCLALIEAASQP